MFVVVEHHIDYDEVRVEFHGAMVAASDNQTLFFHVLGLIVFRTMKSSVVAVVVVVDALAQARMHFESTSYDWNAAMFLGDSLEEVLLYMEEDMESLPADVGGPHYLNWKDVEACSLHERQQTEEGAVDMILVCEGHMQGSMSIVALTYDASCFPQVLPAGSKPTLKKPYPASSRVLSEEEVEGLCRVVTAFQQCFVKVSSEATMVAPAYVDAQCLSQYWRAIPV